MDKEMQRALAMDAEKLSAMTGEEHHVYVTCNGCDGTGEVRALRRPDGRLDFISGVFDGENMRCQMCDGEGFVTL